MPDPQPQQQPNSRIVDIVLDEGSFVRRNPDVEHERAVAIYDLLDQNSFEVVTHEHGGPYVLHLRIQENRLVLDARDEQSRPLHTVMLSLTPFRRIVRDYFMICESYYSAIKTASPTQIEAIDMGRRGLHNEGAEMLAERVADHFKMDSDTARRLFTLFCVLQARG